MSASSRAAHDVVLVVGISRESAPVEVRERAALDGRAARRVLHRAIATDCVSEAFVLSTCNRTEVYAAVPAGVAAGAPNIIREILSGETRISREELVQLGYARSEETAAEHLFGVVAGLNSAVLGEPEIVGQVRGAVALARAAGTMGPLLNGLVNHAVRAGRRVRRATAIARGSVSISAVAVDVAARVAGDLTTSRALLVGAGSVARAVAHRLAEQRIGRLVVANRSLTAARRLAREVGGEAVGLESVAREIRRADIVVCATGAPSWVVSSEMLTRTAARVVLDLAVPRDVEPAAREVSELVLRDIDDLQRIAAANLDERRRELPDAWSIVRAEATRFQEWRAAMELEPILSEVRRRAEQLRRAELERALARGLDREQLVLLDTVTRSLVKKLLHEPTARIRGAGSTPAGRVQLAALCDLFGVGIGQEPEQPARPRLTAVA